MNKFLVKKVVLKNNNVISIAKDKKKKSYFLTLNIEKYHVL